MITENEIDSKLQALQGKVPSILIKDLRDKLVTKMDILTPDQLDVIVRKVLDNYSSQAERLQKLDKRVEEIGKYLEEIRKHLMERKDSEQFSETSEAGTKEYPSNLNHLEYRGELDVETPQIGVEIEKSEGEDKVMTEELQIPKDVRDVLLSTPKMKARLERIPNDAVSTMIALKWLGFLIDRAGINNLENILEFYYTIGWISEEVLEIMLKYASGTRAHQREPNWKPDDKLTIQDHLISLLFIERLRGTRITPEVLNSIERELKMMNKILEYVYGV